MKTLIKHFLRPVLRKLGYDIVKYEYFTQKWGYDIVKYAPTLTFPVDFSRDDIETFCAVHPYTATTPERVFALIHAVKYIVAHDIPGAIVECGVWKGGSIMAVARTLLQLHCQDKEVFLYDTFEGMTMPDEVDVGIGGDRAVDQFHAVRTGKDRSEWCYAPLEAVQEAVYSTGYHRDKFHFIKGKVEDTLPAQAPEQIALLRLDTDWYESTRHELLHLYPRLSRGGVLLIDDYGDWEGARKAVDEFLERDDVCILLNRIDHTGRIGVKI